LSNCKLIIKDEVNIQINGLEIETRRKIVSKLKYELPYARHMPAYKLGRWDGTKTFFSIGGTGFLAHLDVILPIIQGDGYEIEVEDNRKPINLKFQPITESYWADQGKVWPVGHRFAGEPIMLRDDQAHAVNLFLDNPQSLQSISTGAGKCQPLYSKVLTPGGFVQMGDIQVGDLVLTPTGESVKVLDVYEPGKKDVYKLTFEDGRSTNACSDHIWKVHNINWRNAPIKGLWRHITTTDIINGMSNTKQPFGVPLVNMEHDNTDIELPLDPWLMGFLLGDGSFRNGKIMISSADKELVDKVESKLDSKYTLRQVSRYDYIVSFATTELLLDARSNNMSTVNRNSNGHMLPGQNCTFHAYVQLMQDLNLMETYSHTKFIPEIYFNGSLEQRLELIRGLVDSDGTVTNSIITLSSTSHDLALGFQRLIRSVGGIAKIRAKTNKTYVYNGIRKPCKDSYTVSTKFPKPWMLASLTRKVDASGHFNPCGDTLKLKITSIEFVSNEPVKCIMIDSPEHLYVTDEYVVTHNTITTATLSQLCEPYGRSMIIVPSKDLVLQTEEDYKNVGLDVGVYYGDRKEINRTHTICTWQSLDALDKKNPDQSILSLAELIDGVTAVIVDECFDGGARVLTADRGYIPIKDIESGDTLINYSEETKEFKVDTVVKQHRNITKSNNEKMYELEFDNGAIIKVTGNHKFLTTVGWIRADELTEMHCVINKETV
jgi:hypothetical protein